MKKLLAPLCILFIHSGIAQPELSRLFRETNQAMTVFERVSWFKDEYLPLDSIGLPAHLPDSIRKHYQVDGMVSVDQVYAQGFAIYDITLELIVLNISEILHHPDFSPEWAKDSLPEFGVVLSPDDKLLNLVFDENSGGTYRSRVSFLAYYSPEWATPWVFSERVGAQGPSIQPDGFGIMDTINTPNGTAYLMWGMVQGCSTCFEEYIQVIHPKGDSIKMLFNLSVASRDWNDKITWDKRSRQIHVRYTLDDLTDHCICVDEDEGIEDPSECICTFYWNGSGFTDEKED